MEAELVLEGMGELVDNPLAGCPGGALQKRNPPPGESVPVMGLVLTMHWRVWP